MSKASREVANYTEQKICISMYVTSFSSIWYCSNNEIYRQSPTYSYLRDVPECCLRNHLPWMVHFSRLLFMRGNYPPYVQDLVKFLPYSVFRILTANLFRFWFNTYLFNPFLLVFCSHKGLFTWLLLLVPILLWLLNTF